MMPAAPSLRGGGDVLQRLRRRQPIGADARPHRTRAGIRARRGDLLLEDRRRRWCRPSGRARRAATDRASRASPAARSSNACCASGTTAALTNASGRAAFTAVRILMTSDVSRERRKSLQRSGNRFGIGGRIEHLARRRFAALALGQIRQDGALELLDRRRAVVEVLVGEAHVVEMHAVDRVLARRSRRSPPRCDPARPDGAARCTDLRPSRHCARVQRASRPRYAGLRRSIFFISAASSRGTISHSGAR